MSKKLPHQLPKDLQIAVQSNPAAKHTWEQTSDLAKNEWICWVISCKKAETRGIRIHKAVSKLSGGMKRPCCWAGCKHRSS